MYSVARDICEDRDICEENKSNNIAVAV
jgi:hypothetical protein